MPVLSKYVVEDSDVSLPDAVLRFVRLRFPLSDEDVVCFKPTMAQVRIFPQFLRLVKEMELVGVGHPAGLFMVDPPAEWASNVANFTVYGDDEELLRPVHEHHDRLSEGHSFRHSTYKRRSTLLGRFREEAARVSDSPHASDTYDQDAVENPPFTVEFFDEYFSRNEQLQTRFDSTFGMVKSRREKLIESGIGLLEPPCYAANLEGSLMSDGCQVLNLNSLGTALDFVRPLYPGISTPYVYFGQKGTMAPWHAESMSLMSVLYLGKDSAPKIWYACPDREGFEKLAADLYPEFAEKCDQHVSHSECCIAPELVRRAGLPLSVCIQAEGSFVVTRYNTMHMVWNTGYSEASAVNLMDDEYREVAVDVLERRIYCLCDTLPELHGELKEGDDADEFHDIAVRREGTEAFSIRVPRRREVVRFNLHFFREAWRAVDERRELLATVSDLRSRLAGSSSSMAPRSVSASAVVPAASEMPHPSLKAASLTGGSANDVGDAAVVQGGALKCTSREVRPSASKKLALTLTPRVASEGAVVKDLAAIRRPAAVASASSVGADSFSSDSLPALSSSMASSAASLASERVAELTLKVFLEDPPASMSVGTVVPARAHACLSRDVLKLVPATDLVRATELPQVPLLLLRGGTVPPRGGGEMDFGSDSDSEKFVDGSDSDVMVAPQKRGSSSSVRVLRKRPVVAFSESSGSSRTPSPRAALSRTPSPDASGMWMCIYCRRRDFSSRKILRRHQMHSKICVKSPRRKPAIHQCADCDAKYSMKHELSRHRQVNHSGGVAAVKRARSGMAVVKKKAVSDESAVKKAKSGDDGSAKAVDTGANRLVVQLPSTSPEDFL